MDCNEYNVRAWGSKEGSRDFGGREWRN